MTTNLRPTPLKSRYCLAVALIGIVASMAGWPSLAFVQIAAAPLFPLLKQSKVFWFYDKPVFMSPLGGTAASLIYAVLLYVLWSLVQAIQSSSRWKS